MTHRKRFARLFLHIAMLRTAMNDDKKAQLLSEMARYLRVSLTRFSCDLLAFRHLGRMMARD
ncbi:hypothetical protein BURKHO8Y_60106 [Burkholderia sp. 8Y]|nr:hypothetical protein BURKHO8Y_60106 [Burkholderia sp. 8Y]